MGKAYFTIMTNIKLDQKVRRTAFAVGATEPRQYNGETRTNLLVESNNIHQNDKNANDLRFLAEDDLFIEVGDVAADKRARFKDISIKKRSLYTGQTQDVNLANVDLTADRDITIQQLIDFVKSDFAECCYQERKIRQSCNIWS